MEWTDICITVPRRDAAAAEAIATGISGSGIYVEDYADLEAQVEAIAHVDLIEEELLQKDRNTVRVHLYLAPDEADAAEIIELLRSRLLAEGADFQLELSGVEQSDWENGWKKYYKTFNITDDLVIVPAWEDYDKKEDEKVIILDSGMAFGTGTHETTRLVIKLLEKYIKNGMRVADVGCGSGILAICASSSIKLPKAVYIYSRQLVSPGRAVRSGFCSRIPTV